MIRERIALVLRWIARIGTLGSLLFVGAFVFGRDGIGGNPPTAIEWMGLTFFPIGVLAGQLLAFRSELAGGITSIASLSAFYLWNLIVSGHWAAGPWFAFLTLPAPVFIAAASLSKTEQSALISNQSGVTSTMN